MDIITNFVTHTNLQLVVLTNHLSQTNQYILIEKHSLFSVITLIGMLITIIISFAGFAFGIFQYKEASKRNKSERIADDCKSALSAYREEILKLVPDPEVSKFIAELKIIKEIRELGENDVIENQKKISEFHNILLRFGNFDSQFEVIKSIYLKYFENANLNNFSFKNIQTIVDNEFERQINEIGMYSSIRKYHNYLVNCLEARMKLLGLGDHQEYLRKIEIEFSDIFPLGYEVSRIENRARDRIIQQALSQIQRITKWKKEPPPGAAGDIT